MSLKKQFLKSKPVCKVTFKLSKQEAQQAKQVSLVGDFNDWDHTANPMKSLKDGSFTLTLNLEKDRAYHFRYLLDNQNWENDWSADAYAPSPLSWEENSVVQAFS